MAIHRFDEHAPKGGDEYRFAVVDVETANAFRSSICQIGVALVTLEGEIRTMGTLIDPRTHFDVHNIAVHGIVEADIVGMPSFRSVIEILRSTLRGIPVFQHSTFDQHAIRAACLKDDIVVPKIRWLDSIDVAKAVWPHLEDQGGYRLPNVVNKLGIAFDHHDAVANAKAVAQLVLHAEAETGMTFGDIVRNGCRVI